MNVKLTRQQEQIVKDEIRSGHFRSAEAVITSALQALRTKSRRAIPAEAASQRDAVREMLDFVEKNHSTLQRISVKQLIHEGHRL